MSSDKMSKKQQVVVVGGGGYGAAIARTLSQKLDASKQELTLISSRDYYLFLVGMLRTIVTEKDSLEKRILIPYDTIFTGSKVGKFKQGTVASVKKNEGGKSGELVLESGETVPWDVLVVVPGNKWEGGLDMPESKEDGIRFINDWRAKFKKAEKIVLVGGGAVGIELAGELRDEYPKKSITLVHGESQLLTNVYPSKFRKDIEKRLKRQKIDLVLGNHIEWIPVPGVPTVETTEGKSIPTDLVVPTRGGKPNTEFLKSLGSDVLSPSGHIKIQPTLQLVSETNIFSAGDAIDFKEQKQIGKSGGHIGVVVANVLSVLNGQPPKKKYTGTFEAIFITIGKTHGAGFLAKLWGLMFGDKAVSTVKGKGLFIDLTRKQLGAPVN